MPNITSKYTGVKISKTTYNYFSSASEHFANVGQAAVNCSIYAGLAATYGGKAMFQGVFGLCAYKEFAGEVMTGHAFGFAIPKVLSVLVAGVAGAIYHHLTAVMATFVTAAILTSPENAYETVKNAAFTGLEAAHFVYENTAGIANGVAGICNLVYENLPRHSEVSNIASVIENNALELVGNGMLALEYNV
ncbi:MAG TPA: hypothetical protein LFV90_06380 [Rickettsia endosymbiont of Columbicola hoogstraali]|nr:hypothetical protein [Rickettsia endosymbiont of Columbicola hoogstraali]